MKGNCSVLFTVVSLYILNFTALYGTPLYTIHDLGDLGSRWRDASSAHGINSFGDVVGGSKTSGFDDHAFLWHNGVMQDLGLLGGERSQSLGINDAMHVVGYSHTGYTDEWGNLYSHAFLWKNGAMLDLGTLGGTHSFAQSINNKGQIVGSAATSNGSFHAFLWEDGVMHDLHEGSDGSSTAYSINDLGEVAGTNGRACIWRNGSLVYLDTLPENSFSLAWDINNRGQVVGEYGSPSRAFLWTPENGMTDLGVHPSDERSQANAINDYGRVVGSSSRSDYSRAVLWLKNKLIDLNSAIDSSSGWVLLGAQDINNAGQIVGSGRRGTRITAFLLTPIPTQVSVDIRPGNDHNFINIKSKGLVPVAILTTPETDASTIDSASVILAGASAAKQSLEDVDNDGDEDLLLHFRVFELQLASSDTEAILTGMTLDGTMIKGRDSVSLK